MDEAGYLEIGAVMAVASLVRKGLVTKEVRGQFDGEDYDVLVLAANGWLWLEENIDTLVLRKGDVVVSRASGGAGSPYNPTDIPF